MDKTAKGFVIGVLVLYLAAAAFILSVSRSPMAVIGATVLLGKGAMFIAVIRNAATLQGRPREATPPAYARPFTPTNLLGL